MKWRVQSLRFRVIYKLSMAGDEVAMGSENIEDYFDSAKHLMLGVTGLQPETCLNFLVSIGS